MSTLPDMENGELITTHSEKRPRSLQELTAEQPDAKRHRGQIVLDEETYISALSHVITRDYFPDLQVPPTDLDIPNDVRLDSLQNLCTSEDNASFAQIMETQSEARKIKYSHLHGNNQMLLEGPAKWKYRARNSLMYSPAGLIEDGQTPDEERGGEKSVVRENTRLQEVSTINDPDTKPIVDTRQEESLKGDYNLIPHTPKAPPPFSQPPNSTPKAFHMADTPRREVVGLALSSKAAKSLQKRYNNNARASQQTPLSAIRSRVGTGYSTGWSTVHRIPGLETPASVKREEAETPRTLSGRKDVLSSAAKRFLENCLGGSKSSSRLPASPRRSSHRLTTGSLSNHSFT